MSSIYMNKKHKNIIFNTVEFFENYEINILDCDFKSLKPEICIKNDEVITTKEKQCTYIVH